MSKLSEAIVERLGQAKRDGIRLQMADVKRIIEEEEAKLKPVRKVSEMSDEEWILSLEQDPAMQGVDVRREIAKAQFWAKQNRRVATRRMLVNWLNKAERVVSLKAQGAQYATGLKPPPPPGPDGWRDWLDANMPDEDHSAHGQLLAAYNCDKFTMMPASWQARCRAELLANMITA